MGVLIIGAGGHAKVVTDILQLRGVAITGYLDDHEPDWGTDFCGYPVLGATDRYQDFSADGWIIATGSNAARQRIAAQLGAVTDQHWINAIHPSAVVADSVQLGNGVVIAANVVVNPATVIGNHVILNTASTVDHDCMIDAFAHIPPGCHLAGTVRVGEGAFIGIGSSVIPNMVIGSWSVVGAGSVVVRSIPERVTAKGVPARWQPDEDEHLTGMS